MCESLGKAAVFAGVCDGFLWIIIEEKIRMVTREGPGFGGFCDFGNLTFCKGFVIFNGQETALKSYRMVACSKEIGAVS
jgi:hypothetical protein